MQLVCKSNLQSVDQDVEIVTFENGRIVTSKIQTPSVRFLTLLIAFENYFYPTIYLEIC